MRTRNGFLTIETRRMPLVDVTYQRLRGETQMKEDFREGFEEYLRIAALGVPVAYLLDMRDFDPLTVTAALRKEAADIFQEYVDRLLLVSVAEARVLTNPITRHVLTAFDWLTTANKWPCRQFKTMEDAELWLREELSAVKRRERGPVSSRRF